MNTEGMIEIKPIKEKKEDLILYRSSYIEKPYTEAEYIINENFSYTDYLQRLEKFKKDHPDLVKENSTLEFIPARIIIRTEFENVDLDTRITEVFAHTT